jgi:hypothetical protein
MGCVHALVGHIHPKSDSSHLWAISAPPGLITRYIPHGVYLSYVSEYNNFYMIYLHVSEDIVTC